MRVSCLLLALCAPPSSIMSSPSRPGAARRKCNAAMPLREHGTAMGLPGGRRQHSNPIIFGPLWLASCQATEAPFRTTSCRAPWLRSLLGHPICHSCWAYLSQGSIICAYSLWSGNARADRGHQVPHVLADTILGSVSELVPRTVHFWGCMLLDQPHRLDVSPSFVQLPVFSPELGVLPARQAWPMRRQALPYSAWAVKPCPAWSAQLPRDSANPLAVWVLEPCEATFFSLAASTPTSSSITRPSKDSGSFVNIAGPNRPLSLLRYQRYVICLFLDWSPHISYAAALPAFSVFSCTSWLAWDPGTLGLRVCLVAFTTRTPTWKFPHLPAKNHSRPLAPSCTPTPSRVFFLFPLFPHN